jgi:predicted hotdog family 3-hydroxylacyl-ACP dehydratase
MLLVEEVVAVDDSQAVTRATVSSLWPLTDDRGAQVLVLVELAAQTAGICNGLQIMRTQGVSSHRGWIAGIKSARFFVDILPIGAQVEVISQNQFEFEGFREISVKAAVENHPAAEIVMQLVQANESNESDEFDEPDLQS